MPATTPDNARPIIRIKLMLALITWNRVDYLKQCMESWLATRSAGYDWVVAIADDGSTDGTLDYLASLDLPHETHILRNYHRYAAGQTNTLLQLSAKLDYDIGFKIDDDVIFRKPGWDTLYVDAIRASGFGHLCHLNLRYLEQVRRRQAVEAYQPRPTLDASRTCQSLIHVSDCQGALYTFVPKMLEDIGYNDELNFPIRGQWHLDYTARACRAGYNNADTLFDASDSNAFIDYQECQPDYRCSLPWGDEYKKTKSPRELSRRSTILGDDQRTFLPFRTYRVLPPRPPQVTLNEEFEKIFVLNLDRRLDRWAKVSAQALAHGVTIHRWSATDGNSDNMLLEWQRYAAQKPAEMPPDTDPITDSRGFYLDYDSNAARIAHQEQKHQSRAIRTPGAWGYLHSMRGLIKHAIDAGLENILVLDDDVLFHGDLQARFGRAINQIPVDWTIVQLGALQYHWEPDWITWYSRNSYLCNGTSIGSHAVAIHRRAFTTLLAECERFRLPYDIGALHMAKRKFRTASFTMYPNLMIQDVSESDIGSSDTQALEGQQPDNIYRWHLPDYPSLQLAHAS